LTASMQRSLKLIALPAAMPPTLADGIIGG
jgi:hypothetical protein